MYGWYDDQDGFTPPGCSMVNQVRHADSLIPAFCVMSLFRRSFIIRGIPPRVTGNIHTSLCKSYYMLSILLTLSIPELTQLSKRSHELRASASIAH